jgi:hypothetical protein
MVIFLRQIHLASQSFLTLNCPGILPTQHAQTHMRRRGESNFRIEIFTNIRRGQKGELRTRCPELVLLTVPNILEYFYTKI